MLRQRRGQADFKTSPVVNLTRRHKDTLDSKMELRRLCKEFLYAPIAYPHWLNAGEPKEQVKRGLGSNSAFLRHLFSSGALPGDGVTLGILCHFKVYLQNRYSEAHN